MSSSDVILALCQISVIAGGVEEGKYKGKLHLQIALEWWDDEGLAQPTISKHIRATIQPLLDGLLDTEENETWPLKIKAIPKVKGVRAKGGWFYQVAYTQKDRIYDHCRTFHTGVDAAGATKLGTFCVTEFWAEALSLYLRTRLYSISSEAVVVEKGILKMNSEEINWSADPSNVALW